MKILFLPFFLFALVIETSTVVSADTVIKKSIENHKYLVEYSWGNHDLPHYIANHVAFIESMPFDGIVIDNYAGEHFFTKRVDYTPGIELWSRETIAKSFVPLRIGIFKKFSRNFARVNMGMGFNPPPLADDASWKIISDSAQNYAGVMKDFGIAGIFLDNEIYSKTPDWWIDPQWGKPLAVLHAEQARRRGRQLMAALMAAYPEIVVIVAISPSQSCSTTADLSGYFFSGMAMVVQKPAVLVDGGEIYALRSEEDFARSYQWRKYGMATSDCNVVPESLRPTEWANRVSIGFGVYDRPMGKPGERFYAPMNPAIARITVEKALRYADTYVWHYTEQLDWWAEAKDKGDIPLVTNDWIQAIRTARDKQ